MVNIGEPVGVIAAQSIGEPGTQLTMRTFHIGGAASGRSEQSALESRYAGKVKLDEVRLAAKKDGSKVVMNRKAEIVIIDLQDGREKERHKLVYGSVLKVKEGEEVAAGALLSEWDPFTIPLLSDVAGRVEWKDLNENTMEERTDERTGFSEREIIAARDKSTDVKPRIVVHMENGEERTYNLPIGVRLVVDHNAEIDAGDIIAKRERATTKTKDITGGLPRVVELFEARKPKDPSFVAEVDGVIEFGDDVRGKRRMYIRPEFGDTVEYQIPKNKHISVEAGDHVRAGDTMTDGDEDPHDILKIKGINDLAEYLVNEVQQIYRLQGVKIDDKHIEVIVRQMLRKVLITDMGDSDFLIGDSVERVQVMEENQRLIAAGKTPAQFEYQLLGITKSALNTESFITAASFQETTKVLTEASLSGKVDYLTGLKENVVMGKLIPAGTGVRGYNEYEVFVEGVEEEEEIFSKPKMAQSSIESLAALL